MTDDTLRDRLEVALCHSLCTSDTADHDPTVHRAVTAALAVYRDGHAAWVSRAWFSAENRAEQAEAERDEIAEDRDTYRDHDSRVTNELIAERETSERQRQMLVDMRHTLSERGRQLESERDKAVARAEQAEAERDRHIGAHRRDNQRHANRNFSLNHRARRLENERDELQARAQGALACLDDDEVPPAVRCDQAMQSLDPPLTDDDLAGSNKRSAQPDSEPYDGRVSDQCEHECAFRTCGHGASPLGPCGGCCSCLGGCELGWEEQQAMSRSVGPDDTTVDRVAHAIHPNFNIQMDEWKQERALEMAECYRETGHYPRNVSSDGEYCQGCGTPIEMEWTDDE